MRAAQRTVETLTHDEATRRNIPTAEHQAVLQREQENPILADFLADVFPEVAADVVSYPACWVAKGISHPKALEPLEEALGAVAHAGQLEVLGKRCRQEHPLDRAHHKQHDLRVISCLTEACAFAWAVGRFGHATFRSLEEGVPDVLVEPDMWVEAKCVSPSDEDRAFWHEVAQSGGGVVPPPPDVDKGMVLKKFTDGYADALKKFVRVQSVTGVVFFNVEGFDRGAWSERPDLWQKVIKWADENRGAQPGVDIVLCDVFEWRSPVYTSLVLSSSRNL